MGNVRTPRPVLLLCGMFSQYPQAIQWARTELVRIWGPLLIESEPFEFRETRFYDATMGSGLRKQWLAFEQLVDPAELPKLKQTSNQLEQQYAESHPHPVPRPLNLDPGYLTEAKLVLATTKNREHRIYLSDGIFAEVTLYFQEHHWKSSRWTYPDYQRPDLHAFLNGCRDLLREKYQVSPSPRPGESGSG